jgi:hypothetical protein
MMESFKLVAQDNDGNAVQLSAYQEEQVGHLLGVDSETRRGVAVSEWRVTISEHSPYDG